MSNHNDHLEKNIDDKLIERLKDAEKQAREYNEILDILPDIIYKIDPEGYFVYLSKSIAILGYTPKELLGRHFSSIVSPEDLPFISRKAVLPQLRGKETGDQGAPKLFDERRTGERMTKNLIVRLVPKNPTEFKETAEQHSIPGEVCSTGHYVIIKASSIPESEGDSCSTEELKELPIHREPFYVVISNYGEYKSETDHSDRDFVGTVGLIRDISDRKKLEQKQVELEQQIFHSRKLEAIGTLAGGIAHDFNNLLQGVFGFISMAKMTIEQKGKAQAMLEQAEKALHMSINLTSQLLTFSKGGKPIKKKIMIQPLIENSVKFALSGSRNNSRIEIDKALRMVEADEGQLSQVIQNIIINADQAMPNGGTILITAQNFQLPTPGRPKGLGPGSYIKIAIQDNGIGIPEHFLSKIFDPYFTTKDTGSGLGLATSYSIVKKHGGMIDVKSEIGKGSTFSIYLPALETEEKTIPPPLAIERPVHKSRILVMDDEPLVRDIAVAMIDALGHESQSVTHGQEAIDQYRVALSTGKPFHVVILDLTIRGGMGGEEAIKRLREINPDIQAVVSSGYTESIAISEYESCGFKAFLRKPYNVYDMRDMLNKLLPR